MNKPNETLLLRMSDLRHELRMGESTIKHLVSQGTFPKPIKLSSRTNAWRREDITGWLDSLSTRENEVCN